MTVARSRAHSSSMHQLWITSDFEAGALKML